jgi:hypothetical protein
MLHVLQALKKGKPATQRGLGWFGSKAAGFSGPHLTASDGRGDAAPEEASRLSTGVALRELVRVERRSVVDIGRQLPDLSLQLVAAVDCSCICGLGNEDAAGLSAPPHIGVGNDLLLGSEWLRQCRGGRTRIRKRGRTRQNRHQNSHLYVLQIGSLMHTWKVEWTFVRS